MLLQLPNPEFFFFPIKKKVFPYDDDSTLQDPSVSSGSSAILASVESF